MIASSALPMLPIRSLATEGTTPSKAVAETMPSMVEQGLTDQVLDDPQHPYTQLLVSSVLQP